MKEKIKDYTAIEKFEKEFVIKKREFSITDWSVFKRNLFLELLDREQETSKQYEKRIKELEKTTEDMAKQLIEYKKEILKLKKV